MAKKVSSQKKSVQKKPAGKTAVKKANAKTEVKKKKVTSAKKTIPKKAVKKAPTVKKAAKKAVSKVATKKAQPKKVKDVVEAKPKYKPKAFTIKTGPSKPKVVEKPKKVTTRDQNEQELLQKGKERGFITYDEIIRYFPNIELDILYLE